LPARLSKRLISSLNSVLQNAVLLNNLGRHSQRACAAARTSKRLLAAPIDIVWPSIVHRQDEPVDATEAPKREPMPHDGSSCAGKSTTYSKLQRDESHYPDRIACYVLAYFVFRSPEIQGKRMYD
jgi:hypothetical protein